MLSKLCDKARLLGQEQSDMAQVKLFCLRLFQELPYSFSCYMLIFLQPCVVLAISRLIPNSTMQDSCTGGWGCDMYYFHAKAETN